MGRSLLNKVPKKKAEKTQYELWKGINPSYKYLRVWGCLAKVAVPLPKKVKIRPKTINCIFMGYAHMLLIDFLFVSQISQIFKRT